MIRPAYLEARRPPLGQPLEPMNPAFEVAFLDPEGRLSLGSFQTQPSLRGGWVAACPPPSKPGALERGRACLWEQPATGEPFVA